MLDSLHIKNFRCFEDLTIPSLGRVNLIVGKNNSGKSTLLDAIYLHANSGNIWAIKWILSRRADFAFNSNPRNTFDSLKNIFQKGRCDSQSIISRANGEDSIEITHDKNQKNETFTVKKKDNEIVVEPKTVVDYIDRAIEGLTVIPCEYSSASLLKETYLSKRWDKIKKDSKSREALNILKIIEPRIKDVFFTDEETDDEDDKRVGYIELDILPPIFPLPLKSMGEGLSRLFKICLYGLQASGGVFLIDEIENGLHYSIQEEVWEKLFKLAKELDIQVFATTHSEDTIKAFCKVAMADEEVNGKIISLGRSAYGEDKGKITAIIHGEPHDLQYILDTGMEVR